MISKKKKLLLKAEKLSILYIPAHINWGKISHSEHQRRFLIEVWQQPRSQYQSQRIDHVKQLRLCAKNSGKTLELFRGGHAENKPLIWQNQRTSLPLG